MDLTETTEGRTSFLVPVQDTAAQFPPGSAPIFFNRRMAINRDITVLLLPILGPSDYLDAMGATGIRGLRVAGECGIPVTICDREPDAVGLIARNVERSGLPIAVVQRDVNALLSETSFDAVDLDPFGTPAPFVDAAVRGTRRFLFVTATDTAPLCGAHLKAGIRRYSAYPMNTPYHSEVGLRILMGFVVRQTARYDRGVRPIFCYAKEHFARLHLRLLRGAQAADESLKQTGYIHQCRKCPYREEERAILSSTRTCPDCGGPLQPVGPLWLGDLHDRDILPEMRARADDLLTGNTKELIKLLDCCLQELPVAGFYDYHVLARRLRCSPPDITVLLRRIEDAGYPASRTHFSGYGIKTTAPLGVVLDAIGRKE